MDLYHVLNRGVEKRDVVLNDDDRMRFVRGLYLFNDIHNAPNAISQSNVTIESGRKRELLVDIHAWCLMDNHYHILLSPKNDDVKNISFFMKKLNMGYAKFFNEKYKRTGYLWQGRYKKIAVKEDSHFHYIPYYIHLNPLDKKHKEWRSGEVVKPDECINILKIYRWSSYLDYNNQKNFPSVITKKLLGEILQSPDQQAKTIRQIILDPNFNNVSNQFEV